MGPFHGHQVNACLFLLYVKVFYVRKATYGCYTKSEGGTTYGCSTKRRSFFYSLVTCACSSLYKKSSYVKEDISCRHTVAREGVPGERSHGHSHKVLGNALFPSIDGENVSRLAREGNRKRGETGTSFLPSQLRRKAHSRTRSWNRVRGPGRRHPVQRPFPPSRAPFPDRISRLITNLRRFTGEFASKAKHVTAVEFMAKYLEVNKETNARYSNIDFLCCDVTKLHLENSYDFVFTNWLLTYLTDEEISTLLRKAVR